LQDYSQKRKEMMERTGATDTDASERTRSLMQAVEGLPEMTKRKAIIHKVRISERKHHRDFLYQNKLIFVAYGNSNRVDARNEEASAPCSIPY